MEKIRLEKGGELEKKVEQRTYISDLQVLDVGTDSIDDTHELVAQNWDGGLHKFR